MLARGVACAQESFKTSKMRDHAPTAQEAPRRKEESARCPAAEVVEGLPGGAHTRTGFASERVGLLRGVKA